MTKEEFRTEMSGQFARAKSQGRAHVEVNAGELHRQVGGFPPKEGEKSAIAECCAVMRTEMKKGDAEVLFDPPKGVGPALTVRYEIPRPKTSAPVAEVSETTEAN